MRILPSILCLSLMLGGLAASDAPLGSSDFYPSPMCPIGHRGDGNGWFPGATPETTWSDGTVTRPIMPIRNKWGKVEDKEAWDLAETGATNIVWRVPTPSWANTQPLVVGDLVFCYGEPDWLYCYDAHQGKLLWQLRISVWRAAGLPAAEVVAKELIHDVYGALEVYRFYRCTGTSTRGGLPSKTAFPVIHETFVKTCLPRMLSDLKKADPKADWDRAADDSVKISSTLLEAVQGGERKEVRMGRTHDLAKMITERIAKIGDITIRLDTPWGHMVGHQMSCPVSDGTFIYVAMGQGQVAAVDLTGKIVWAKLTERKLDGKGGANEMHIRSPLLADGLVITCIGGDVLRAYDAATGDERWQAPFPRSGCRSVGSDKVVTVGLGAAAFKVIVTTHCNVIRVKDGTALGSLPFFDKNGKPSTSFDGGPSMIAVHQADGSAIVCKGASGDNYASAYTAHRLSPDGDGVKIETLWDLGDGSVPGLHGIVATDRYLLGPMGRDKKNCVDIRTGTVLRGDALRGAGGMSLVVAGTYAIGHDDKSESNAWEGRRPDQKMLCRFTVIDMKDPSSPKMVADRNILGGKHLPTFPPAEKYIPELWADEAFVNGCGGRISHFINLDTGITPMANRIFIRSTGHLYCIGDPRAKYSWNPASRPAGIPIPVR